MFNDDMNSEFGEEQEARELQERAFDARIALELERAPDLSRSIPSDFAARVAGKVPQRKAVALPRSTHYGRTLMAASLVVLLIALVVLAMRGFADSAIGLGVEWCLCVQFLAIAVWMGTRFRRSS
jgi:hypothetical protein